jgi:hypothetical protein
MAVEFLPVNLIQQIEAAAAVLFVLMLLRLALLLGATPVGAMRREILYLRGDSFRPLLRLLVAFLLLEAFQMALQPLVGLAVLGPGSAEASNAIIDLIQAVMLVAIAWGTLRAFRPYSRRSLAELEVVARRSVEIVASRVGRARPRARSRRSG